MAVAFLTGLLLAQDKPFDSGVVSLLAQDKFDKAAERVAFPDEAVVREMAGKGAVERRLVGQMTDRKVWAAAFRQIEAKLGLFAEDCEVKVVLEESADGRPAQGGGKNGKGTVKFNMRRLGEYYRKVDEYLELERLGKRIRWQVPPLRFETMVAHELAHVFCGTYAEKWLTEGIACFASGDTSLLYAFNHRGSRVEALDKIVPDEDAYARGMAFFAWMDERYGADKVRDFAERVTRRGEGAADAAAAVTRMPWARIVLEEKLWSAAFIEKFKTPP